MRCTFISKKSGKKLSSKVQSLVKSDLFTSIAIVSIALNIFLLVGLFTLTTTDSYDTAVFNSVRTRYCKNIDGVVKRAEQLGNSEQALQEWKVNCVAKEFAPYYQEALQKFEAHQNN